MIKRMSLRLKVSKLELLRFSFLLGVAMLNMSANAEVESMTAPAELSSETDMAADSAVDTLPEESVAPVEVMEASEEVIASEGATEAASPDPEMEPSESTDDLIVDIEAAEAGDVKPTLVSWRERYTLGPGDVVNIRFYGQPNLTRNGVRIAPDGTISYLQVNSLQVADSTIDELRGKLENALKVAYRHPRLIITPWELKSKRYTILGKVIDKGVFTLERPITLLEAIARSRGIETGLFESNTVELADMERSFIIRNGEALDVDFSQLYFEGDLTQNVYLEPHDYIYLASNLSSEYFVFGAVTQPGAQGLTYKATVVTAITRRLGFSDDAWKRKILVVRGSLTNPETFVINVREVLNGHEPDFLSESGRYCLCASTSLVSGGADPGSCS